MGASPSVPSEGLATLLLSARERACKKAAELISGADVFLLCTGAGFSADSGLAVYADVAEVQAYKARGLKYHDICQPQWLHEEPALFWGFWGQCFNDYRNTAPHEGYAMLDRWAERRFRSSKVADSIRAILDEKQQQGAHHFETSALEPYHVAERAGAFYAYTSNVDAHHFDWFRACEIRECHGNTELYQCSSESCGGSGVWRAPLDFRFAVDKETMLASQAASGAASPAASDEARMPQVGEQAAPAVGRVRGGGRAETLRYMPGPAPAAAEAGFAANHPVCRECGAPARPAILMFGDYNWTDSSAQSGRWSAWQKAVRERAQAAEGNGGPLKVAILEIGAGGNVTTVRSTSESCLDGFLRAGADARLIRVNPDMPAGDGAKYALKEEGQTYTVDDLLELPVLSIMGRGLETLRQIDAAMPSEMSAL